MHIGWSPKRQGVPSGGPTDFNLISITGRGASRLVTTPAATTPPAGGRGRRRRLHTRLKSRSSRPGTTCDMRAQKRSTRSHTYKRCEAVEQPVLLLFFSISIDLIDLGVGQTPLECPHVLCERGRRGGVDPTSYQERAARLLADRVMFPIEQQIQTSMYIEDRPPFAKPNIAMAKGGYTQTLVGVPSHSQSM